MRAVQLLVLLLGLLAVRAEPPPPEWMCSPTNTRNLDCPQAYQGDGRCTEDYCPPFAGCATPDCNAMQGNIQADKVVALDAYAVKGSQCTVQTMSLPECCSLCRNTKGCNAFTYCNAAEGCGSGCENEKHAFSKSFLPLQLDNISPKDMPDRLNPAHACTAAGAWPFGMCSLKFLAPESLEQSPLRLAPGNQAGWVSGLPGPVQPAPQWGPERPAAKAPEQQQYQPITQADPAAASTMPEGVESITFENTNAAIGGEAAAGQVAESGELLAEEATFASESPEATATETGTQTPQGTTAEAATETPEGTTEEAGAGVPEEQPVVPIPADNSLVEMAPGQVVLESAQLVSSPPGESATTSPESATYIPFNGASTGDLGNMYINPESAKQHADTLTGPEIPGSNKAPMPDMTPRKLAGNSAAAAQGSSAVLLGCVFVALSSFFGRL